MSTLRQFNLRFVLLLVITCNRAPSINSAEAGNPNDNELIQKLLKIPKPGQKDNEMGELNLRLYSKGYEHHYPGSSFVIQVASVGEKSGSEFLQWRKLGDEKQLMYDGLIKKNDCVGQFVENVRQSIGGNEIKRTLENISNASLPTYASSVRLDIILRSPTGRKSPLISESEAVTKYIVQPVYEPMGALSSEKFSTSIRKCGLDIKVQSIVFINQIENAERMEKGADLLLTQTSNPAITDLSNLDSKLEHALNRSVSHSFRVAGQSFRKFKPEDADKIIEKYNASQIRDAQNDAATELAGLLDPVQTYARDLLLNWLSTPKGLGIPKGDVNQMLVTWRKSGQLKKASVERLKRFYEMTSNAKLVTWNERKRLIQLLGELNSDDSQPLEMFAAISRNPQLLPRELQCLMEPPKRGLKEQTSRALCLSNFKSWAKKTHK